jgi:hypothetical protein
MAEVLAADPPAASDDAASADTVVDPPPGPQLEARGLIPAEAAKVARLAARLSSVFRAAGYAVESCRAGGDGRARVIDFCVGRFGPAVLTFRAAAFAAGGDDDVVGAVRVALTPAPVDRLPE